MFDQTLLNFVQELTDLFVISDWKEQIALFILLL